MQHDTSGSRTCLVTKRTHRSVRSVELSSDDRKAPLDTRPGRQPSTRKWNNMSKMPEGVVLMKIAIIGSRIRDDGRGKSL